MIAFLYLFVMIRELRHSGDPNGVNISILPCFIDNKIIFWVGQVEFSTCPTREKINTLEPVFRRHRGYVLGG